MNFKSITSSILLLSLLAACRTTAPITRPPVTPTTVPVTAAPINPSPVTSTAVSATTAQLVSAIATQSPPATVSAGINVWTSNGPEGGVIDTLAIDPATPTTLYAGGNGVFKSTNGGAEWRAINTGLTNTLFAPWRLTRRPRPRSMRAATACSRARMAAKSGARPA